MLNHITIVYTNISDSHPLQMMRCCGTRKRQAIIPEFKHTAHEKQRYDENEEHTKNSQRFVMTSSMIYEESELSVDLFV